jgi:acyl carrier protein
VDVLGFEEVGIEDDFFAIGGHSLLATQVVARIRNDLAVDLPLHALFTSPTVETLVQAIAELSGGSEDAELAELLTMVEGLSDEESARLLGEDAVAEE